MIIKKLSYTSLNEIIECFLIAFNNYFVPIPASKEYYIERWKVAKIDFGFSYGMFEQDKLVAFILHTVEERAGSISAYNAGTGVIPEYRGRGITKMIYDHALNDLSQHGIKKIFLEAITQNTIAIEIYESLGFQITKRMKCFSGKINSKKREDYILAQLNSDGINWAGLPNQSSYSWENQQESIKKGDFIFFEILRSHIPESYFLIHRTGKQVAQLDILDMKPNAWNRLFSGIKEISAFVKINNVDERQSDKIEQIGSAGLSNFIDQFEMELNIDRLRKGRA